jgi:hypothetical protein
MSLKIPRYLLLALLATSVACQPVTSIPHSATNSSSPRTTLTSSRTPTVEPSASLSRTSTPTPLYTPTASLLPTLTEAPISEESTPIRVMRVDYPDYSTSRSQVATWEKSMQAAGINLVALGAGRVEWTYFKWAGHETNWSSGVRDTGIDFLKEDTSRFSQWAQVNAVVDVLSPNYIATHPGTAAIRADGVPSQVLVSTAELTTGEYGKQLLAMIEYIAANYPVNSISLTELFYHIDGYGADDKALYMAYSGNSDWPRNSDGTIDVLNKSIGDWRTHALDVFLDQIVVICHQYKIEFFLDVGLTLDYGYTMASLNQMTNEHGTNYQVVLQHTDKIVIWGYFSLDDFQPEYLQEVAQFLSQFDPNRIILSIGLWGKYAPVVSADALKRAVLASQAGGISNIWITPGSLMSADHWQVLDSLWK